METVLTNLRSLGEVTLAALILGAGLPMLFALGVRLWSAAVVAGPDGSVRRNPAALAGAYLCLLIVLSVVIAAVLFVAKAFLADRLGIHLFGQA
ncbi:hypothetical protein [Nocardia sp. NBC_01329]|uniref:hypothetical protein n=1 Tax=Nocardia sp. NBC_01329 TaxID=2903594 RepID=UPI002E0EBBEF|nr:hypothetical protein OG405_27990 [Nocardia sp. NBC_01329]